MANLYRDDQYFAGFQNEITAWNTTTAYEQFDLVSRAGLQWSALRDNTTEPPITPTTAQIMGTSSGNTANIDNLSQDIPSGTYTMGFMAEGLTETGTYARTNATSGVFTFTRSVAFSDNAAVTITTTAWEQFDFEGLGYRQFITLEQLVVNFMFSRLPSIEESVGRTVGRHEIEYHFQRAIQDFNYDLFSIRIFEYELVNSLTVPMPQDLVKVLGVSYVNDDGLERFLRPRYESSNANSAQQTEEGAIMFQENGDILLRNPSYATQQYNAVSRRGANIGLGYNIQGSNFNYGRQFYINPKTSTINGTYIINSSRGTISVDSDIMDVESRVLTIRYVSDGLSPNIQDIKVPKQAEAAIEAMVRFELLDQSDKVTLYNKQRAQRRKAAEYNNAKIRISDYGLRNLIQQLKGKRRWIKV